MELLGKIFGDPHRVKMMRLFLWNEATPLALPEIIRRSQVRNERARRELNQLTSIGFLTKKQFTEKVPTKTTAKKISTRSGSAKTSTKKVRKTGWVLNPKFALIEPIRTLLIDTELVGGNEILRRLRESGKIELLLLSGIFVRDENRKVDVLVVGNNIDTKLFEKQMSIIESEVGRELSYSLFDVDEFNYRLGMYDKLLRDVLENHHTTLVNKLSL